MRVPVLRHARPPSDEEEKCTYRPSSCEGAYLRLIVLARANLLSSLDRGLPSPLRLRDAGETGRRSKAVVCRPRAIADAAGAKFYRRMRMPPWGSSKMAQRNTHAPSHPPVPDTHFPFDTGRQGRTSVPTLSGPHPSAHGFAVQPRGERWGGSRKLVDSTIIGRQHAALNFAFLFGLFLLLFLLLLLSLLRLGTLARFRGGGSKETVARVKQPKPSRAGSHNGSSMTTLWPVRHPRTIHLTGCQCLTRSLSLRPLPSLLGSPRLSQAHP